ncbi:MAG: thioredoxin, partial [Pseudomonadota bacterium]
MADAGTHVIELGEDSFASEVLESDALVLVDFWATWCGPCKALAPTIDRLANEFEGRVKVAKIDIDGAPKVAEKFGVRGVPNVIIFKNGKAVTNIGGVQPHAAYQNILDGILGGADTDEIADNRMQNPDDRLGFLMSASVEEIRGAFERCPEYANAPVLEGLNPLEIALRFGLSSEKIELFASYHSTLSFDVLVGLGHVEQVRAAIETHPELVNAPASDGATPLTIAMLNARSECAHLLLDAGAVPDPAHNGVMKLSPIELAIFQKDLVLVERLLDAGVDAKRKISRTGASLLHLA